MAKNRLTITHKDDSIQLVWQRGQDNPRFADAVPFQHPFDREALIDLRWYLEEFLRFPYGIEPDKAQKIEQKLQEWGEQLFSLVFRSSEKARQFFQAATWDGLNQCQLSITSDDPAVLNLPWELLYSPDDRKFLAPSLAQMYRSLSDYKVRGEMGEMQQEKLNILLVIARPLGEKDIGFQTIARPMLAALKEIRQQVNLKVLRPPSFQEYYKKAFNFFYKTQDWYSTVKTITAWGKTLEAQQNWIEALKTYIQACIIHPKDNRDWLSIEDLRMQGLARMLKQLGESEFDAIWRGVTGEKCDGDVRAAIWSARDNLETE